MVVAINEYQLKIGIAVQQLTSDLSKKEQISGVFK
jgi:hypothetical protein